MAFFASPCPGLSSLFRITAAFLAIIAPASGELVLTADSVAQIAREKNPDLLAARGIVTEAEGRARSAGRLANPEIETEIAGGRHFEGRVIVGVTQRFPLTARLRLERNLSTLGVERARLEVLEKMRQLTTAARAAFYELATAREAISLANRQAGAVKEFARSLENSAAEGLVSSLDAGQAALASERLDAAKGSLLADEALAAARLATLLGLAADTPFVLKETVALPEALPAMRPIGFRPDLQMAEMAVQAGAIDVSLAKASRWDDVGGGVFVEGERVGDDSGGIESGTLFGIRLSVQLPVWQDGSGKVAEKQAVHDRQQKQLEALRFTARNQALAAHQAMAAHYHTATQAESRLLPMGRKQLADTEAAYRRGEIDIQTLFRGRERLTELEISALEARKKFHLSHSEWLVATGGFSTQP